MRRYFKGPNDDSIVEDEGIMPLGVATSRHGKGTADRAHCVASDGSNEPRQSSLIYGLNVVEIYGGILLQSFCYSDYDLTGCTENCRSDWRDDYRVKYGDSARPAENDNRTPLNVTPRRGRRRRVV
jgi:hypothetical protein